MKRTRTEARHVADRLFNSLSDCLTPESARRLVALKPDVELVARIDEMAARHTEGRLSPEETAEYGRCVAYASLVAVLKSKARQPLAGSGMLEYRGVAE